MPIFLHKKRTIYTAALWNIGEEGDQAGRACQPLKQVSFAPRFPAISGVSPPSPDP